MKFLRTKRTLNRQWAGRNSFLCQRGNLSFCRWKVWVPVSWNHWDVWTKRYIPLSISLVFSPVRKNKGNFCMFDYNSFDRSKKPSSSGLGCIFSSMAQGSKFIYKLQMWTGQCIMEQKRFFNAVKSLRCRGGKVYANGKNRTGGGRRIDGSSHIAFGLRKWRAKGTSSPL